jgi:AraC-like DNA-binding protein
MTASKTKSSRSMNKPAKPPIIRANVLASVVAEVLRRGGEVEGLLRAHIETVDGFRNPYQEIPLARYLAFFEAASDLVGDPYLGAHIGARFQPEELGPLGVIFVSAPSLHAALNRLGFFLQAWQGGTTVELELRPDTAEWIYQIDDPALRPRRQDAEFSVSATCSFIRTLLGSRWAPIEVHFEHSAPRGWEPHRNPLTTIFRAPVLFDQSVNRLLIERNDLGRAVSTSKQALAPYLEQHLRDLMSGAAEEETFSTQVSYVIAKRLGRRPLDLQSIAVELGVSQRTLQRRLKEENASLRGLIREQRARIAEPLLQGGGTPIMSIAHNLGYADPTVFSRAFKAWRGRSPRDFRKEPEEE